MLRKILTTGISMCTIAFASAQDSTGALTISGNADVYYKYDFGKTKANNLTSFTNSHNRFEPGMATLKVDYKTSKTELVADLGFGKRAQEFSYNDEGILAAIKQLYISYSPTDWVKFTAGSWATHVGYELVDAPSNRNYSMSYMFTNGPFFHTGVKADITVKKSGFMLGVANPTDYKYVPDGVLNKKFLLAQYSYAATDDLKLYLNFVYGKAIDTSKSNQVDLVITDKITGKFNIGFNGTINHSKYYMGHDDYSDSKTWWGSALYLNLDPTEHFGLTLRSEYFTDKDGLKMFSGINGGHIFANTLSVNFRTAHFIFIPEFRIDHASKSIFVKGDGSPAESAANVLFAAIYQF